MDIYSTIKATPNHSKRTFTIRVYDKNTITKYRTNKVSEDEFLELEFNTVSDWRFFLRNSNDYYKVK
jgi:hypothetical protein